MTDVTNYWIAWGVYLVAAGAYFALFWRVTRFRERRILRYCLRALMLAVIATPWYVSDSGSAMAPAVIIVLMDAITISGPSAARAMVPLFLAMALSQVIVVVLLLIRRKGRQQRLSDS